MSLHHDGSADDSKLKMLTLNCWGLYEPFSKLRKKRMEAIGEELSKGEYDIVVLQEVWIKNDYRRLCDTLQAVLPYNHYFHSGVIGAGICIFSKHPILETFQHPFTLSGPVYNVHHGDWFAGKAVGLAQVLFGRIRLNVYVTHTQADYPGHSHDLHKAVQAYELSQFVKNTSDGCDAVLMGGDFNTGPDSLPYKLILCNANLKDTWVSQRKKQGMKTGATCSLPESEFVCVSDRRTFPDGRRLDYIMYRNNAGCDVICEESCVTMTKVPGQDFNFSDHAGVAATFIIKKNITVHAPDWDKESIRQHLSSCLPVLDEGLQQLRRNAIFYSIMVSACLVFLLLTSFINLPGLPFIGGASLIIPSLRAILVIAAVFFAWIGIISSSQEHNSVQAARKDICNRLRSCS